MSKSKQDEVCHCGSGEEYRNCCGRSNVIQMKPQIYNEELLDLKNKLLDYALTNYHEQLTEPHESRIQSSLGNDKRAREIYLTGLTVWGILSIPITEQDQTIFDLFYKQYKGKMKRTRTKNTFLEWKDSSPAVYEILITNDHTQMVTVRDLLTNQMDQIQVIDELEFFKDDILIGTLVPFVGYHCFLADMLEVPSQHKDVIIHHLKAFSQLDGGLRGNFPGFLAAIILAEQPMLKWEDSSYEDVAHLFLTHLTEQNIDDEIIAIGVMIWHKYVHLSHPVIKKPMVYAAALEYLMLTALSNDVHVTQKDIALTYQTTAGTISKIYRDIIRSIEDDMNDDEDAHDLSDEIIKQSMSIIPENRVEEVLLEATKVKGFKREKLIREALTIDPNNTSAFLILAEDARSKESYEELLKEAIHVGEKKLSKAFFLKNKGHFWIIPETRPYMKAKEMYADFLYHTGNNHEAIHHFTELLRLNPTDNQGVRYPLLTLYIESGKFMDAAELIDQFQKESTAAFLFNKVVVDYLINGFTDQTKQFLKNANRQNSFVKDYLIGNKIIPNETFDYMSSGDEPEAITYAQKHIHIWESIPDLLIELSK